MKQKYFKLLLDSIPTFVVAKTSQMVLLLFIVFVFSNKSYAQTITSFSPAAACIDSGTSITITGMGFLLADTVEFNGTPAIFYNIDSDTQITATLPISASTGKITVIIGGILSNSLTDFIIDPFPTASAGGTQTICSNATAIVDGVTATNGTISWSHNGAGSLSNATTLTPTYNSNAADAGNTITITMTVTSNNTCSPQTATATYTVIVQSTVTSGTIATAQTICIGSAPATLTSASDGTGSGTITYEWQTNASGSYVTIPSANAATYSPPALTATTSYQRRTISTQNGVTCYSDYTTPLTVTVGDIIPPTITCPANIFKNNDPGICGAAVTIVNPTATDNCSTTFTFTGVRSDALALSETYPVGLTTITWTAKDDVNNVSATCNQTITIADNEIPTINSITDINTTVALASCTKSIATTNPTTADNCSVTKLTWAMTGATTATSPATGINNVGTYLFNLGTTTVTYTVFDAAGNSAVRSHNVTVTDNIKPTITAPSTVNVTTNTNCTATGVNLGTPTTGDNCSVASVTNNHPSTTYPLGNTTVTWTVTDGSGNITTANQIVTVVDNIPPTITCPGNKTAYTSANGTGDCSTTVTLGTPVTADNCGVSSIVATVAGNLINPTTYAFPIGETTVIWTVTDNSGLTASCTQNVTVTDNEKPTISCPGDQNVSYDASCQYVLQEYTSAANTTDNCDSNITITQSPAPGTLISAAITTVTLTAKDAVNNSISCTFKVNATDNIAPVAVCKNYTAYLSANGTINVAALNLDNGSSDNCGIANMTVSPNSFNCSDVGDNTVTFTVFDNNGNSNSCQATITVVDNTLPTMICKNYVVVVDAITRVATITASNVDNGSNDACGIASLSVFPYEFPDSPNVYTATTTLTAVDVNGNSNTCTAIITVEPPKNQFTYLTGEIVNPIPDNPQSPSALVEVTACPGGITVPKDIKFTLQAIGTYNLQATDVLNWEYSDDNGETWTVIPNTTGLLTYTLTGLTSDTFVRLRITDADDATLIKTSAEAYARFLPPDEPPIIVSHTALDICLNESVTVNAESFYDQPSGQFGKGGKFNYAQPDGWRVDGLDGFFPASGNNTNEPTWKESNGATNRTFSGIFYDTSDNTKFAMSNGIGNTTTLETPVFSTIGMTSSEAIMKFYTAYYFCNGGSGKIELSFNAGEDYTVTLNTMEGDDLTSGNTTGVHVVDPNGQCQNSKRYPAADPFRLTRLDLGAYAGLSGLRVRFTFTGSTSECQNVSFPNAPSSSCTNNTTYSVASGWAIDDVGFSFATVDDELEWTDEDGTVIATGTTATVTPVTPGIREYGVTTLVNGCRTYNSSGTNYVNINTSLAYAGEDYTPLTSNCGESSLQLNAYDNSKTAVTNFNKGSWKTNLYVVPDTAAGDTDYLGTGVTGVWSIVNTISSSCGNNATFSSNTDPDAIFTADPGSYTLRWTLTNGCYDELNVTLIDCKTVDFDGANDYVSFKNNYNQNSNFSIEVWVKPNSINNTRTVFSRKNAGDNSNGYDLSIVNGQVKFNWYNGSGTGTVTTGSNSIGTDRWYHLAVTFNGTTYKLYVDGLELGSADGSAPDLTADTIEALLGAMYRVSPNTPTNYFHGWIDELKIWNKAISVRHIRQMMNQEIDVLGTDVGGVVIPLKIYGSDNDNNGTEDDPLLWSDLVGYYRMNVVCGNLDAFKGISGRLHNINTSEQQTAPIPYTTRVSNQTWDTDNTWTNYSVWNVPNSKGINNEPIDWNIVKTNHKVISNAQDLTLLGLLVQSNSLIITNSGVQDETNSGHGLWITHYLKLDGFMDLVGESQLVQKRYTSTQYNESVFEETSSGYLERDQQGQKNSFNYNYWTSPVSPQGSTNNAPFSISAVLRDGTDSSNPKTITFGNGAYFADGPVTSPIKISNRWIWAYNSLKPASNSDWDNYYQWRYIASAATIKTGEGYTMKGTGGTASVDATQNYVFTGKPHSGTIPLFLTPTGSFLIGNPYPCALDADEFIKDNIQDCGDCRSTTGNSFNGALYFWDHFGLSNNHILGQYEGGYATYTLVGGVVAVADESLAVNNGAMGTKAPKRYIPIGQAFFIEGSIDSDIATSVIVQGGPIIFKNNQRFFVRESSGNSLFLKSKEFKKIAIESVEVTRPKITLRLDSSKGASRQLLVGADPNTTNEFDLGYDAPIADVAGNSIYWEFSNSKFVIQGVPNFDEDQIIPLGIKLANEGEATLKIAEIENFPESEKIYLYDKETDTYYNLKEKDYIINLPVGEYTGRFSIQFYNKTISIDENNLEEGIELFLTNSNNVVNIKNHFYDVTVNTVQLYNMLGQAITSWNVDSIEDQTKIKLPVKNNIPSGIYIVKAITSKGILSKKVIVKQ